MGNTEHVKIVQHISLDELESMIKGMEDRKDLTDAQRKHMEQRLKFIRLRYKEYSVAEAADILGVNRQSGYNWQSAWNSDGPEALVPSFDGGAPSKMTREQKADIASYVAGRQMCTEEVRDYVMTAYGVDYSEMQISRILRAEGLVYRRGYKVDHRRRGDCDQVLKKTSDWCWMASGTT